MLSQRREELVSTSTRRETAIEIKPSFWGYGNPILRVYEVPKISSRSLSNVPQLVNSYFISGPY